MNVAQNLKILPEKEGGAAAKRPVIILKAILSFIKENPVLTAAIILAILLAIFAVFMYIKYRALKKSKITDEPAEKEMDDPFTINIGNTHHIGARESQQDSFAISDISNKTLCEKKGVFAVVADGMGGLANGAEISKIVTSSMLRCFNERSFHSPLEIEMLNMVSSANQEVNRYLGRDGKGKSGSTVVSVILKDRQLYWTAVGDSRICLVRNGAVIQVNRDHTYGPELDEKAAMGQISYEEAQQNPQRHALTSYLGMGKLEKIDRNIRPLQLVSGDRILLMSDGIFGTLCDEEISSVMKLPPYESAAKIEQMVLSAGRQKQDNFTAIILECI